MPTDSRDSIHEMLKSIDEHAAVLQNNLHYQFCLQSLCNNLPVLQLAPVSPTLEEMCVKYMIMQNRFQVQWKQPICGIVFANDLYQPSQ